MTSLIPRKLGRLQRVILPTLTATALIQRKTLVDDDAGGQTTTWSTSDSVPCSFSQTQISPVERENTITVKSLTYWGFTFPSGTDVHPEDRILVGDRTFEVVGAGEGSVNIVTRAICLEIQ